MTKIPVKFMDIEDRISDYVYNNPIEIYIDYRDELSSEQVDKILEGKASDVILEIEEGYMHYEHDFDDYWERVEQELDCTQDDIDKWLHSDEGFYPSHWLTERDFEQLMDNTSVQITATMWDVDWNFDNWAFGAPVTYSDVKEALKVLGVNPYEFKKLVSKDSTNQFKGYFPNMPDRKPAVDIKLLLDEMITLYDGVLNFCLGDLANIKEVVEADTKNITFKKGTNVVMYNFGNGAGIVELPLIEDVTVPRKMVEFRNDATSRYGIQACYGFIQDYWRQGEVQNEK